MYRNPEIVEYERAGAIFRGAVELLRDEWRGVGGDQLAMDAQPALSSTPNSDIPAFLTTIVDPQVYQVLFAPNKGAEILDEVKKGTWLDDTAMFPFMEAAGEVSSYGDYSNNGMSTVNANFPQRQAYLYQTFVQYGEREMERADLARLSWASANQQSAITILNKYQNLTYHLGVNGLANYGLVNEPGLPAALTPGPKANGGTQWVKNGVINATPNEIYIDFQSLVQAAQNLNPGMVDDNDEMVFVYPNTVSTALTTANGYNTKIKQLILENYPRVRLVQDPLYAAVSAQNPYGIAGGNLVQLWIRKLEGRDVGYCAFNEKLRTHRMLFEASAFKQKMTQGTWGAVIRYPSAAQSMLGV
jgi:hypothetical protein